MYKSWKLGIVSLSGFSSNFSYHDIVVVQKNYLLLKLYAMFLLHTILLLTWFSFFFVPKALYKSNISCPSTNQSASRGVKTTICCPVSGFPPPEVTWRLPNGTVRKTTNTILSITPKTESDFGKYTCSAAGLKETVPDPIVVSIYLQEKGKSKYIFLSHILKYCKQWLTGISRTFWLKIFVSNWGCSLSVRTSEHHAVNLYKLTLLNETFTDLHRPG